jgi:glycopeptide antibiotics resistance protein
MIAFLFFFTVVAAGLVALAWAGLRWWRGASRRDAIAEALMIIGTLPWVGPLLAPNADPYAPPIVHLIPFVDLAQQLHQGPRFATFEIGGNLLVLAALGFFLPIRWRFGLLGVTAIAAAISTGVEVSQYLLVLHRTSSIDDVIVNTAGAVLAALASYHWWRRRSPEPATVATEREHSPIGID